MSILAGVKGYLTYVTLGYKSLLELRRSLGDVDPLNLIKDKDATLQKGQEHADVLTREFVHYGGCPYFPNLCLPYLRLDDSFG